MINILKIILLKLFSLLPDSPFTEYFETADTGFLTYLDWFLPVQICSNILLAWLACVLVYYIYLMIKKIATNLITGIAKAAAFL